MTENEARSNEAEWRELFEHSPLMYFVVDAAGTVLSVNESGAAELGYQVGKLVGQSVLDVFSGSDRERVRRNLDLCLERPGQLNTWEAQKIRKDGTTLWVSERAKAVERARGDVVVLIACEDITQRRRAEEAVRESAKRFRALIEHAFDVVLLLDRDCGLLYASPSVERVLGYAPRELVGRNGLDLIHPDQLKDASNQFASALVRQDSVFTSERLIQHKHGRWLWTENTMTNLLGEPSVRAFVVNLRDITSRKRTEEALRESEQRFRDYTETASDWFWESGPDHRFTDSSQDSRFTKSRSAQHDGIWLPTLMKSPRSGAFIALLLTHTSRFAASCTKRDFGWIDHRRIHQREARVGPEWAFPRIPRRRDRCKRYCPRQ